MNVLPLQRRDKCPGQSPGNLKGNLVSLMLNGLDDASPLGDILKISCHLQKGHGPFQSKLRLCLKEFKEFLLLWNKGKSHSFKLARCRSASRAAIQPVPAA